MNAKPVEPVVLYHRELGGKGKAPLVVLHGLLGSTRNWQMAGADLAHAGAAHVIALDLRNHGRSGRADSMGYDALAADVAAWMDSHNLMRVMLLGHSIGGKVAMALACRFPQRVGRLVVVDVAPRDYGAERHREVFAAMNEIDMSRLQRREEAEALFEARVADASMRKFLASNLVRDHESGWWRWSVNLPVLSGERAGAELGANPLRKGDVFEGETLFVAGGKSDYVREEDGAVIRRHFPNARVEVLAESGHNPHVEARDEFTRVVAAFLKR